MYNIRTFQYKDLQNGLADLINNGYGYGIKNLDKIFDDIRTGRKTVFVAEDDGWIVGMITLSVTQTFSNRGTPKAFLNDLKVADFHRENGIGGALLSKALETAKSKGLSHVTLASSDINKAWYERKGFVYKYYHMVATL